VLNSLDDPLLQSFHCCGVPSEFSVKGFFTGVEAEGKSVPIRKLFSFSTFEGVLSEL